MCVSTNPGSRNPPRRSVTGTFGMRGVNCAVIAACNDLARADQQPAILVRTRRPCPSQKRISRRVKERSPQHFAAFGSTRRGTSGLTAELRVPDCALAPRAPDGEEDALGRRRELRAPLAPPFAERRHRIANRLAHRNRQHQRRLAHRLAAEDHTGLSGALQKIDVEHLAAFRTTKATCKWTHRRSPRGPAHPTAVLRCVSQPTPCMNPPSIWPRSTIGETRVAHVFQNVRAQQPRSRR